jgi:hypothetical protein
MRKIVTIEICKNGCVVTENKSNIASQMPMTTEEERSVYNDTDTITAITAIIAVARDTESV